MPRTPKWAAEQRLRRRALVSEIKLSRGCMDCGYCERSCALDFDHRPGEVKLFDIGKSITRSWQSTLDEIEKCDVVCANCHRVRSQDRLHA